jgi:hypothetical protein
LELNLVTGSRRIVSPNVLHWSAQSRGFPNKSKVKGKLEIFQFNGFNAAKVGHDGKITGGKVQVMM